MLTPEDLFKEITGCDFRDKETLLTLQESFKMKPHLVDRPGMEPQCTFESAWEKSERGDLPLVDKILDENVATFVEPSTA